MVSSPITLWQFDGKKMETLTDFIFLGSKITMDGTVGMKLKDACSRKENYDKPRQHIKNQRHHFVNKGPCNQSYVFSSSQVHMWGLDHKEGWMLKNWCFWIVVLESPLGCKEIKPVNPKGTLSWIFIGRTVAETPILRQPDVKCGLIGKRLMLGKTEGNSRLLDNITDSMDMNLSKLWEIMENRGALHVAVHGSQRVRQELANEQQ